MEQTDHTFAAAQQKNQRKKRLRTLAVLAAAIVVLAIAAAVLVPLLATDDAATSVLTWQVTTLSEGEISTSVSGSGTLTALSAATFTAPADAVVEEVLFRAGDHVSAGDTLLTLSSDALDEELEALEQELDTLQSSLATASQEAGSLYITAPKAGVVKQLTAAAGDVVEDAGTLCLISTDGRMKLVTEVPETVKKYDVVSVVIGDETESGLVTGLEDGQATIVIEENRYAIGAEAAAYDADGNLLGSGALALNECVAVTGTAGRIDTVLTEENKSVSRGGRLFLLEEGAPSASYLESKEEEADLLEQIAECRAKYSVVAEWDATVTALPVSAGDEVLSGDTLCSLAGTDGYTMSVSVDELDIGGVAIGQSATITLDAIDGTFSGVVSDLSYEGSGSYVTSYTATLDIDPIEGALPGMSASAEIVTETSGQTLIVPVDAVQYEGDETFLYLAGSDTAVGTVYAETDLDLTQLTRVPVETGMSDGSYIAVSGKLSAGELILIPLRTTTSVYEEEESNALFAMPGSMGSGSFGGDFGGDFGGAMPEGGFSGGGRGGERPNE